MSFQRVGGFRTASPIPSGDEEGSGSGAVPRRLRAGALLRRRAHGATRKTTVRPIKLLAPRTISPSPRLPSPVMGSPMPQDFPAGEGLIATSTPPSAIRDSTRKRRRSAGSLDRDAPASQRRRSSILSGAASGPGAGSSFRLDKSQSSLPAPERPSPMFATPRQEAAPRWANSSGRGDHGHYEDEEGGSGAKAPSPPPTPGIVLKKIDMFTEGDVTQLDVVLTVLRKELNVLKNDEDEDLIDELYEQVIEDMHDACKLLEGTTKMKKKLRKLTTEKKSLRVDLLGLLKDKASLEHEVSHGNEKLEKAQAEYDKQQELSAFLTRIEALREEEPTSTPAKRKRNATRNRFAVPEDLSRRLSLVEG